MKRILSLILCLTMIVSFMLVTNAEHYSNFTDLKSDSWYYEDVDNTVGKSKDSIIVILP